MECYVQSKLPLQYKFTYLIKKEESFLVDGEKIIFTNHKKYNF
jgi:hypothetical protein